MFEIEKGVEIPKNSALALYPFKTMDVGDSFFVPCDADQREKVQRTISQCARRRQPLKFVTRQLADGVRCWRIALQEEATCK